jgi:hypothetical protein
MDATGIEDLATAIVAAFGDFGPAVPIAAAGAVGLTLLLWGGPRLVRFVKKIAG